jgi:transcriptional regulator with XRE-family HTH domain
MEWSDVESNLLSKDELKDIDQIANLISTLIQRRLDLNLTQQALADKTGLKQSDIARFERLGAIPRIDKFTRIAKTLGYNVKLEPIEN